MFSGRFEFSPARVIEQDMTRHAHLIPKDIQISEHSAWLMLKECLHRAPIRTVYRKTIELYNKGLIKFSDDQKYIVETLLGRSAINGKVFYLVKWDGWPTIFNTWEPEGNLKCCKELFSELKNKLGSSNRVIKYESSLSKAVQIEEVLDRLKEGVFYSNITVRDLLIIFIERLAISSVLHPFRNHQLKTNYHTEGKRPKARKKPRLTARTEQSLKQELKNFQNLMNTVYANEAPIIVENNVDLECPPSDFQPIHDYVAHPDVYLPTKAVVGCECGAVTLPSVVFDPDRPQESEPCWLNRHNGCCCIRSGARIPYNSRKHLIVPKGHPIIECNSACPCGPSCPFRVVQLGRQIPVSIFRTSNGRGWGVKTLMKIPKGMFVMEYLGEIITFEGAETRGAIYDKQRMTYLFDLDFDGDAHYTVDAYQMGNVSHFVNHSCDPNLTMRCVLIECLNTKLPRIALFAARNIRKEEELTFDYQMTGAVKSDNVDDKMSLVTTEATSASPLGSSTSVHSTVTGSIGQAANGTTLQPPRSDAGSLFPPDDFHEHIRMKCLCGSKNCRRYLVT